MSHDQRGFLIPNIDMEKCIDCGMCQIVCPIFIHIERRINNNQKRPQIFAFTGEKGIVSKSSSGGAFSYIADWMLNGKEGYVVGAAYNNDFSVQHIIINRKEDLDKLRISKYVQSDQRDCYTQVKKLLNNGQSVLYTGTPCQIAGLKSFLKTKDYPNLYLVDLLCHGVPPYKLLREYLEEQYGLTNISEICMRKKDGWSSCLDIRMKDGTICVNNGTSSIYMKAFLKDIILRESCYTCHFASLPRYGDLTIGDCWSARKYKYSEPYKSKSSIVLVNNTKGYYIWNESLKNNPNFNLMDMSDTDIKLLNTNIQRPNSKYTNFVNIFWKKYETMNFTESYLKTVLGERPVGLILYGSNNYGSCATNLALYLAIEKMGFVPVILDSLVPLRGISNDFLTKNCRTSHSLVKKNDVELVNKIFPSFVVGSDYSFNITATFTRNHLEFFLMAFVSNTNRKIAYAPSLGLPNFEQDNNTKFLFKHMLNRFDFLSFREDSAVEHCKKYLNISSQTVIDPVFLVNKEIFIDVAKKSKLKNISDYILVYILDPTPEKIELVKKYEQLLGLKKFVILDLDKHDKINKAFDEGVLGKLSFEDFIYYFLNAEFVITDSFHGTCFSLIFNKKYISIKNRNKRRFDTIINLLKDGVDFIPIYDNIDKAFGSTIMSMDYNFSRINSIIDACHNYSNNLLYNALMQTPKTEKDSTDINVQYIQLWRQNYNLRKELSTKDDNKDEISFSEIKQDELWQKISIKLKSLIPSYLELSTVYSNSFYRIYFVGTNHKIHYEFAVYKGKFYFGIHCEDQTLQEACRVSFENIQRLWNINNPKSLFKLNIPINLTNIDTIIIFALDNINKIEGIVTKLLSIKQLHI